MKKTPGDIIILHMCAKSYDQMMCGSWDMVCNGRMYGQTDGQMAGKSDILRWVPHLKKIERRNWILQHANENKWNRISLNNKVITASHISLFVVILMMNK